MFKKIISNLPFSPTLISELGFYAKRLRKEETSRRIGLILTALALVVQSFLAFSPPESVNAANSGDLVYGGFSGRTQMLSACNNNTQGFRDLLDHAKITCDILANAEFTQIHSRTNGKDNGWLSWNRTARFGLQRGERAVKVADQQIYVRPLAGFDTGRNTSGSGSWYDAFIGKTTDGKEFAIMIDCANILLKEYPPTDLSINVCDLATKAIITIKESQFNASKHSKNLDDCKSKPIKVCELATSKMITIDERDFDQSKHSKNPEDCKPKPVPAANCSSLVATKLSRTNMQIRATATTANGATISSYNFIIRDSNGKEVTNRTIDTPGTISTITGNYPDGSYEAEVIVNTSLGQRTSEGCKTDFTIEPIARCPLNPTLPINDPNCQPCPGDPNIWVKDEDCAAKVLRTKKANNLTAGAAADTVLASASDRIEYTLTVNNDGKDEATLDIEDDLTDILEYAEIFDRGGGELAEDTKVLSWKGITLKPGESQSRTYVVRVASQISAYPRGTSDPTSFDCQMVNVFGNTVTVEVDCPAPKVVEQVVPELPKTGPTENMIFGGILAAVVTFLYFRSRQLNKEVRLIRREVTAGTI